MTSRLLTQLEEELRLAPQCARRFVLMAQIASYYARLGDAERAAAIVEEVRAHSRTNLNGEVVGWVNFVEGLLESFAGRVAESRDKLRRAAAIAESINCDELASLGFAWLAFSSYLSEDLVSMERDANQAILHNCLNFPGALSRLSLTLALCLHYCGSLDKARENYRRCHRAASEVGDEVEISALIHNMAWMSTLAKRNKLLDPAGGVPGRTEITASVESALSFEGLIGDTALHSLSPLLAAQDCILNGQWDRAIQLISENTEHAGEEGFSRLQPGLLADRAYCKIQLGLKEDGLRDAKLALELMRSTKMHGDDTAALHSRLSNVFADLGDIVAHEEQRGLAESAWRKVQDFRSIMLTTSLSLDAVLATGL
jgi:tetratricopeptide (TPR) repeat protein